MTKLVVRGVITRVAFLCSCGGDGPIVAALGVISTGARSGRRPPRGRRVAGHRSALG
ncbi:hypothetical protein KAK06_12090 [Ideonella sp. 4Y11]|uniref:Uncharacterized protein n=1 Tax=Ideonella aquatica TaxID=2824119 RepID=A0A940YGC4_9BURK|nr:hypothetical protein [Ideonella aquatica]